MIATLPREILLPRRVEFPAWVRKLGDPLRMFGHGAFGKPFAQPMGGAGVAPAFSPSDIAGLQVWLKADALALNDNDAVGTWTDSSGNSNNATQATAGAKPTYKVNILNGKPVVRFDGTGDYMTIADNAGYKTANITLFVVATITTNGTVLIGYPHNTTHTNPYFRWLIFRNSGGNEDVRWNGTLAQGGTAIGTSFRVFEEFDSDLYLDGTQAVNGTDADLTYPNAAGVYIGANSSAGELLKGDIAEILLYDSSLVSGNRSLVRTYLGTKYGITVV